MHLLFCPLGLIVANQHVAQTILHCARKRQMRLAQSTVPSSPRTRMIPISGEQICFLSFFHPSTILHAGIDLHIAPPPLLSARHYRSRIDHQPECTSFSFALPHPRFTGPPTARACLPTAMTMCCGYSTPRNTCTLGSRRRLTAARRL